MTYDEIVLYYVNLLIFQYYEKTKARAHIDALIRQMLCDQIPITIQNSFNINTAVGKQLEMIGSYLGIGRVVQYNGAYVLTDDELRIIIKFLILKNNNASDFKTIKEVLYGLFGDTIQIFDGQDMKLTLYAIDSYSTLLALLLAIDALPAPAGVGIKPLIILPDFDKIFSYRTYTQEAVSGTVGFNSYDDYTLDNKWLSYSNAL